MILLRPTPSGTNNSNFGSEPASAGFFISVAIAAISAANLPPPTIKKGLAIRQPLVFYKLSDVAKARS
ncbi:hypothetical protein DO647_08840 [Salmonella enterica subsp. enterica]|nr:hypothetical protein [Salmonella enterica]EBU9886450.1 hypothetical protein [Salmonella enterica subsp. enterica serovar Javiana]ECE6200566.1 hypothetical protein [Salmonella enterica subsp. enterica]